MVKNMKKLIIFVLIPLLSLLLISCGEEKDDSNEWGGVHIYSPTAGSTYTTNSDSIVLEGSAPIIKSSCNDGRPCTGNAIFDTGIGVSWYNEKTGMSGIAEQFVEYYGAPGIIINWRPTAARFHTWRATIPIGYGYNNIKISAKSSSSPFGPVLGGDSINVISTINIPVTGVTVKSSAALLVGEAEQLTATIIPANAWNRKIIWESTNTSIVTVTSNGLVTAIALGTAAIKVTTDDGGYAAQCDVMVCSNMFITTWNTALTGSGTTASNQVKLPLYSGGTYGFYVEWGDGNTDHITSYNQAETTHTYSSEGIYDVKIYGTIEGFGFSDSLKDNIKLIDVKKWGDVKLHNNGFQLSSTNNLTGFSAQDVPVLTHVTNMGCMFASAYLFNGNISSWDVSNVTNMICMFAHAHSFNQNISSWNVSNVTEMWGMFVDTPAFNQNISSWNVSNVTDMGYMFQYATAFNQNISSWNVSNVTDMSYMFRYAFVFNQNLDSWNVTNVANMTGMFVASPMEGHPPIWWHP